MGGRSKSSTQKARSNNAKETELQEKAVKLYLAEQERPYKERKGARTVCEEVSRAFFQETGNRVSLNHVTIIRHANGGKSMVKFNEEKSRLKPEEIDLIVKFAEELSDRNIPLTHPTMKQYAEFIIKARDPSFTTLGKNWTSRLIEKNSDRLKSYFSSPMEASRARAVNPNTHVAWFELLKGLFDKYGSGDEPDCIYGIDETGFMPGRAVTQKVIGRAGKKAQGQKESGNRELITVLPAICADGTCIPPLVIFAGQAFAVSWKQNNPLNAL